jgi:hypothetical protein
MERSESDYTTLDVFEERSTRWQLVAEWLAATAYNCDSMALVISS